eukprot:3935448-Amphidinium_carterae.2
MRKAIMRKLRVGATTTTFTKRTFPSGLKERPSEPENAILHSMFEQEQVLTARTCARLESGTSRICVQRDSLSRGGARAARAQMRTPSA